MVQLTWRLLGRNRESRSRKAAGRSAQENEWQKKEQLTGFDGNRVGTEQARQRERQFGVTVHFGVWRNDRVDL